MTPRALTSAESEVVRWLLAHAVPADSEPMAVDVSALLVTRYDESECLRFVTATPSDGPGSTSGTLTIADRDGVPVTAFLVFDARGNLQELDLWKADDSPIEDLRPPPPPTSTPGGAAKTTS